MDLLIWSSQYVDKTILYFILEMYRKFVNSYDYIFNYFFSKLEEFVVIQ